MIRYEFILCIVGAILLLIFYLSVTAPYFSSLFFSNVGIVFYLAFSGKIEGLSREQENRVWMLVAFVLSVGIFFTPDSPLHCNNKWATCFTIAVVYLTHWSDRYYARARLRRTPSILLSDPNHYLLGTQSHHIEHHLNTITDALSIIDSNMIPSTINLILRSANQFTQYERIISCFQDPDLNDFDFSDLILKCRLSLVLYKIKDSEEKKFREELIDIIAYQRSKDLTIPAKCMVITALQILRLNVYEPALKAVESLLLSTFADELTELKTFIDNKESYHDLNKLIYTDVTDEETRNKILEHFQVQAKFCFRKTRRKILSDLDDTLECSGGSYPAGIDERYPKKTVYPGVTGFFRELDVWKVSKEMGNLVFLSARPHLYKDYSESHSFEKLRLLRETKGLHTRASLLCGDPISGTEFLRGNYEPLGLRKYENFINYIKLYPEFTFVWVGDNGQSDYFTAVKIIESHREIIDHVFIHVVQPVDKTFGWDANCTANDKICFFDNYVDAALHAHSVLEMFDRRGLRRLCRTTVKQFEAIKNWHLKEDRAKQKMLLNKSLREANDILKGMGKILLIDELQSL